VAGQTAHRERARILASSVSSPRPILRTISAQAGSAKIIVWRFDGRMAFVPEGQADSSQARSALVAMQRDPVPEGRSKSLSVPQIFVVETEPGMSKRQRVEWVECSGRFRNASYSCGKVRVR
jgi:hypothetical protein